MKTLHLLYHELRPVPSRYTYVTPCEEFEQHCALFRAIEQDRSSGLLCPQITFDDGNFSDFEFAMPILEQHGLKAHFFITAGWTAKRQGFMGWPELRALHEAGHQIGAHGWSHKLLTSCSVSELHQELNAAKNALEDGLGAEVPTLSLPGGRANAKVLRHCKEAGYLQVFTSEPRAEEVDQRPWLAGRLNLRSGTEVAWLEKVLQPETGTLARLHRAEKLKQAARSVLGDRLYGGLWGLVNRQESEEDQAGAAAR
jgi:peptidoglycan/xylan/chitin deacetylase (PgdA/CDA1 family)